MFDIIVAVGSLVRIGPLVGHVKLPVAVAISVLVVLEWRQAVLTWAAPQQVALRWMCPGEQ